MSLRVTIGPNDWPSVLSYNLRQAGALAWSFDLGWERGNGVDVCDTFGTWLPNAFGWPASSLRGEQCDARGAVGMVPSPESEWAHCSRPLGHDGPHSYQLERPDAPRR